MSVFSRPLRIQRYRMLSSSPAVCRPRDAPQGHAHGADPDRILLFGNGVATGRGVASHELAVPGQLARAVSARTGRGADVDVIADDRLDIESAADALAGRDLGGYDAVVVTVGFSDAFRLLPVRRWEAGVRRLLEILDRELSVGTDVMVMGITPPSAVPEFRERLGGPGDDRAARLNTLTAEICAEKSTVHFVQAPVMREELLEHSGPLTLGLVSPLEAQASQHGGHARRTSAWFHEWAAAPADVLAPLLDAQSAFDNPARRFRNQPQAAARRRAVLWEMRLLDSPAESRFDDIVRHAQSLFGAAGAAFSVIDDTRQWNKAVAGAGTREVPIEESFCRATIGSSTALVVADAWDDERVPGTDAMMRFYAGYPLEAADGTRIGALCVFDEQPRSADSVDVALLRDLALAIQRELEPVRA
ncbi:MULTISPECIES: GAF domain-containing protein [unclassified Frondihabitans]|uniref:GAF domain-containing protein n=1 Tax=unclassified Frondihabitans TaxID=2626248 RepID=UPI000F4F4FE4|nr:MULTISPECIES: GAF domain-containing protein [unclassified Frondihabitans]RPE78651.1 hypothetical protein EDF37_1332 [Frondihabitans sp. PhB153]RPF08932.1 hypothetical protein EDF39_1334 [Frondihabitans sp. PhB161]